MFPVSLEILKRSLLVSTDFNSSKRTVGAVVCALGVVGHPFAGPFAALKILGTGGKTRRSGVHVRSWFVWVLEVERACQSLQRQRSCARRAMQRKAPAPASRFG